MSMHDSHYEIVLRDLTEVELAHTGHMPQPYRARIRAANVELTWGTETYVDRDGARGAIGQNASMHSPVHKASVYSDHVDVWLDDEELGAKHSIPIVDVDERAAKPLHVEG